MSVLPETIDGEVPGHPPDQHPRGEHDHPGSTHRIRGAGDIDEKDGAPVERSTLDHHRGGPGQHQTDGNPARPLPGARTRRGFRNQPGRVGDDQEPDDREAHQLKPETDAGHHSQSTDPGPDQGSETPQPMETGHDRAADGFLDSNPYRVHAHIGLGIDEPEDGKQRAEQERGGDHSDQGEEGEQKAGADEGRPSRADTTQDDAADRGSDQCPETAQCKGQPQSVEIHREPVSDLGESRDPTPDDETIGEKDECHTGGGAFDRGQGCVPQTSTRPTPGGQPFSTEGLAVLLGGPAPDACSLVGLQGELEAVVDDRAETADLLGVRNRFLGGLTDREEDGVGQTGAGGVAPPADNRLGSRLGLTLDHPPEFGGAFAVCQDRGIRITSLGLRLSVDSPRRPRARRGWGRP